MVSSDEFKRRTRLLALQVIQLSDHLPRTRTADVIGRQLARCGTSVGANYRAACRARSQADFIAKMGVVEEEADETIYWLELLVEANMVPQDDLTALMDEASQILAMTVASIRTARNRTG